MIHVWRRAKHTLPRQLVLLAGLLLILNLVFLGIRLAGTLLDKEPLAAALREGLTSGSLPRDDFPHRHPGIGDDQWTDCLSMELALLPAGGGLNEALAPRTLQSDTVIRRCARLADYLDGRFVPDKIYTYTRFWHGHSSLTAGFLRVFPLGIYRGLLTMLSYAAVVLAGVAALRVGREQAIALVPLLIAGFAFSGIHYLGGLVSHSPAFISLWLMTAVILAIGPAVGLAGIASLALVAGAIEAFLDTMILCPLSAALTIIAASLSAKNYLDKSSTSHTAAFHLWVVATWTFGFLGSYVLKLCFTVAVLGWDPVIGPFISQLKLRMGLLNPGAHEPVGAILAIKTLYWESWRLMYADNFHSAGSILAATTFAGGWALAGLLWLSRSKRTGAELRFRGGLGLMIGSLIVVGWVLVFPEHTVVHGWFMVRVTIVPIACGWCWLICQVRERPWP